jgi:hypothetical protein
MEQDNRKKCVTRIDGDGRPGEVCTGQVGGGFRKPFSVAFDLKNCGGKRLERSLLLQSGEQHAACKAVFEGRGQVARALGFLATTFPAKRCTRVIDARALTLL